MKKKSETINIVIVKEVLQRIFLIEIPIFHFLTRQVMHWK